MQDSALIPGDTIVSHAQARTPQGRILTHFKGTRKGKHNGLEIKITDVGMGGVFDWKQWKGTTQNENGGNDSATLAFIGEEARDAMIYSLWMATNQLFQTGWCGSVLDMRLTLRNLPDLAGIHKASYSLCYVVNVDGTLRNVVVVAEIPVAQLPSAAKQVFDKYRGAEGFVAVAVMIRFETQFRPNTGGIALYTPSVCAACGHENKEEAEPSINDFYFDLDNERLMLEELIGWHQTTCARLYTQGGDTKALHVTLRRLTVMHDICLHGGAAQAHEMA